MKKIILPIICTMTLLSACNHSKTQTIDSASKQQPETESNLATALEEDIIKNDGVYDLNGISVTFTTTIPNDVTGYWRLATLSTDKDPTEYILNYYDSFFQSDRELHAIINYYTNTTTCIGILTSDSLNAKVYQYINGEEFDAAELFSGTLLKEYSINIHTGEAEETIYRD